MRLCVGTAFPALSPLESWRLGVLALLGVVRQDPAGLHHHPQAQDRPLGAAMASRRILVTSALPYVNGDIHIGHLVEYIQTDIWVRYQKLSGQRCVYICADDTHGTAIMIRARQEGRSEGDVIADMQAAHIRDFAGFDIV